MSDPILKEHDSDCPQEGRNRAGKGLVLAAGIGLGGLSIAVFIAASGLGLAWAVAAYLGFPMIVFGVLMLLDAIASAPLVRRLAQRLARPGIKPNRSLRHV